MHRARDRFADFRIGLALGDVAAAAGSPSVVRNSTGGVTDGPAAGRRRAPDVTEDVGPAGGPVRRGNQPPLLPFQCSRWFSTDPVGVVKLPTAQHMAGEAQPMPAVSLTPPVMPVPPGLGVRTADQVLPFHRRTWLSVGPPICTSALPTAQQLVAEGHKTRLRTLGATTGTVAPANDQFPWRSRHGGTAPRLEWCARELWPGIGGARRTGDVRSRLRGCRLRDGLIPDLRVTQTTTSVEVKVKSSATGIGITLPRKCRPLTPRWWPYEAITGVVDGDGGRPVVGACVIATARGAGSIAMTRPDGRYVLASLRPGRNALHYSDCGAPGRYLDQWSGGASWAGGAAPVTVAAGRVSTPAPVTLRSVLQSAASPAGAGTSADSAELVSAGLAARLARAMLVRGGMP